MDVLSILLGLSAILTLICCTSPAQAHSANEHDFSTNGDRSPAPRVNAAFEFNEQADPVSLVETLRRAVRLLPGVPEYRLKLADALLRLGDHDAAIEEIRSAVAIQNDDGHAQLQLGHLVDGETRLARGLSRSEGSRPFGTESGPCPLQSGNGLLRTW
ncbi:MAG: tetratricopeptide repeat protein [Nitrospira sp.]|nr:tetratricopeptide repeat protein [Nitrospira sp.]